MVSESNLPREAGQVPEGSKGRRLCSLSDPLTLASEEARRVGVLSVAGFDFNGGLRQISVM